MRELSEQKIVRRNKVDEIRKICNPYPEISTIIVEIFLLLRYNLCR